MNQSPILSPNDIKTYITRINELDKLSTNSRMPVDKLSSIQRQLLFKQFNKYIQPKIIMKSTSNT